MAREYLIDRTEKVLIPLDDIQAGKAFTWEFRYDRGGDTVWPAGTWELRTSADTQGQYDMPVLTPVFVNNVMTFNILDADNKYKAGKTYYGELVNIYNGRTIHYFYVKFNVQYSY